MKKVRAKILCLFGPPPGFGTPSGPGHCAPLVTPPIHCQRFHVCQHLESFLLHDLSAAVWATGRPWSSPALWARKATCKSWFRIWPSRTAASTTRTRKWWPSALCASSRPSPNTRLSGPRKRWAALFPWGTNFLEGTLVSYQLVRQKDSVWPLVCSCAWRLPSLFSVALVVIFLLCSLFNCCSCHWDAIILIPIFLLKTFFFIQLLRWLNCEIRRRCYVACDFLTHASKLSRSRDARVAVGWGEGGSKEV